MQKIDGFEITEHEKSKRIIDIKIEDKILEKLLFPFTEELTPVLVETTSFRRKEAFL